MSGRLGPLICDACRVESQRTASVVYDLACPACGTRALEYLWMYTEAEQAEIRANTQLYQFLAGLSK
jgi:hypothetical protein